MIKTYKQIKNNKLHFALRKNINMETQPIPRTTASMNLTGLEESKSQKTHIKPKP